MWQYSLIYARSLQNTLFFLFPSILTILKTSLFFTRSNYRTSFTLFLLKVRFSRSLFVVINAEHLSQIYTASLQNVTPYTDTERNILDIFMRKTRASPVAYSNIYIYTRRLHKKKLTTSRIYGLPLIRNLRPSAWNASFQSKLHSPSSPHPQK